MHIGFIGMLIAAVFFGGCVKALFNAEYSGSDVRRITRGVKRGMKG